MKGSMNSVLLAVCGNCCMIFSRFDRCEMDDVLVIRAFWSHSWTGCFSERVCMRVIAWRTLDRRWIQAGGRPVSFSRAAVDVVLKHPEIDFIAILCIIVSIRICAKCLALLLGRCQMDVA